MARRAQDRRSDGSGTVSAGSEVYGQLPNHWFRPNLTLRAHKPHEIEARELLAGPAPFFLQAHAYSGAVHAAEPPEAPSPQASMLQEEGLQAVVMPYASTSPRRCTVRL